MGLSFHYSGKFRAGASLSEMIQEVKDIVEVCKWKYTIYEEEFPGGQNPENAYNGHIYGISFTPPECETVSLCFLSNRKMSSPVLFMLYGKTNDRPEHEYLYMLSNSSSRCSVTCKNKGTLKPWKFQTRENIGKQEMKTF